MMGSRDAGKIALARCLAILTAYYLGRGMNTRLAAIVIGLLAAGAPTLALDSAFSQSFAAPNKPPKAAAHPQKKPETHQVAADQTGSLRHRKSEPREKAAPVAATYAT